MRYISVAFTGYRTEKLPFAPTDANMRILKEKIKNAGNKFIVFHAEGTDEVQARILVNDNIGSADKAIIVLFDKTDDGFRFVAGKNGNLTDVSLKDIAAKMREGLNARGGGSEQMIQGSIPGEESEIKAFFEGLN